MPEMAFERLSMTGQPTEIPGLRTERSIDRLVSLLKPISGAIRPRLYLGIQFLRDERDQDPHRSLLVRLLRTGVPRDPRAPRMDSRGVDQSDT